MEFSITVRTTHLGGQADVRVKDDLEPEAVAYNDVVFEAMTEGLNRLLATMFSKRDELRFEREVEALRLDKPIDTPKGEHADD